MSDDIQLVLGCFGRQDHGFISCSGIENKILNISSLIEHYNDIMDYLDSCRLFDRPMFEMQAIRHLIFNMRDRYDQIASGKRIWSEPEFLLYQKFLIDHRLCGLYVKLVLVDTEKEVDNSFEEKEIYIKSDKAFSKGPDSSNSKLRLIRGRK